MASQRAAGQRFRQRKLSTKQNLAILREQDVELSLDDEAQRNIPRVETGVEKAEEIVSLSIEVLPSYSDKIIFQIYSRDAPGHCLFRTLRYQMCKCANSTSGTSFASSHLFTSCW